MRRYIARLRERRTRQATAKRRGWAFAEDIPSAVTEDECERLAELARGRTVLELGSFYGRSTVALASTATVVHAVDPHDGGGVPNAPETLDRFLASLDEHGVRDKVVVHVCKSTDLTDAFESESFDLVFIDAMHHRPAVDVDLALAARWVSPGGAIGFHDYSRDGVLYEGAWYDFGVTEVVDEFVSLALLPTPEVVDCLAIVRSPSAQDGLEARRAWEAAVGRLATTADRTR